MWCIKMSVEENKVWFVRRLGKSLKILLPKSAEKFVGKYVIIEIREIESKEGGKA